MRIRWTPAAADDLAHIKHYLTSVDRWYAPCSAVAWGPETIMFSFWAAFSIDGPIASAHVQPRRAGTLNGFPCRAASAR
jgi:hypothetical protein